MPDIEKCLNDSCVMKLKCYRYTSKASEMQYCRYIEPILNKRKEFNCEYLYIRK